MSTIRLSLNPSLEEVLEELEKAYRPMSRTEILKMAIAEFYNSRFGDPQIKTKKVSTRKDRVELVDKWLETKKEPDMSAEDLEEAFGEWWSQNKNSFRG